MNRLIGPSAIGEVPEALGEFEAHGNSMPGGGADAGAADPLAGGREFKHDVDAGTRGIGMIPGEDIDGINPTGGASHNIGLDSITETRQRSV